jgi:hypothetical protein
VASAWHLLRALWHLFDLRLLSTASFPVANFGASLTRMEIGALPFLLPLLFQFGFGLDALHAGLPVLAVFAGNLLVKVGTARELRTFGFPRVRLVNGLLNPASILPCALLSPAMLFAELTRSMQFSDNNTIVFTDIPRLRLAAYTLFSTMFELALRLAVALGAIGVWLGHAALATLLRLAAANAGASAVGK